ncbi:uncharacterized protein LMH87_007689 [Akanthomyces muscarius]|uniref:C2H2-type domain-containing protein n=1 Tax=Akanthomyces muscarius TaxID=2231603 RepID=A0A9W8UNQ2_AKAMU|nr:uncharacterized protein LMH87_007689 [Akanthomyces muscarius]KAJ4161663.1 hypothetical protein LMH87_007689 [Akanthomyces muscarius]
MDELGRSSLAIATHSESDLRSYIDDDSGIYPQPMKCLPTSTGFSLLSDYELSASASQQLSLTRVAFELNGFYITLSVPSGVTVSTSIHDIERMPTQYEVVPDTNMSLCQPMGSSMSSNSSDQYTAPLRAVGSPRSLSSLDTADSSRSHPNHDSPIPLYTQQLDGFLPSLQDLDFESRLEESACDLQIDPFSRNQLHTRRELPRKRLELQCIRTEGPEEVPGSVSAIHTAHKCDHPGCCKSFRRKEHLKRHKQSIHGEGPNRFSCEFCGKHQFNRQDNLNSHRRLHARANANRGRGGVEYIPDAVRLIAQEERGRKRRAAPRSKTFV